MKTDVFSFWKGSWTCFIHGQSKWLHAHILSGVLSDPISPNVTFTLLPQCLHSHHWNMKHMLKSRRTGHTKNKNKLRLYLIVLGLAVLRPYEHLMLFSDRTDFQRTFYCVFSFRGQLCQCRYYFYRHQITVFFLLKFDKVFWDFQNALEVPTAFNTHMVLNVDTAGQQRP